MEIRESGNTYPEYSRISVKTEEPTGTFREELRFLPEEFHLFVRILCCDEKRSGKTGKDPVRSGEGRLEFICTPSFLPEMVLGHLLTEGLIRSGEEVTSLEVFRDRGEALTVLRECAPVFSRGSASERADSGTPAKLRPEALLRPEWIRDMEERVREESELRVLTHAVHSAVLSHRGEIVFAAEDIGRHNAIDKAAGFALRNGIPLGECLLYTTGRMPSDMVMKAVRAGIPVLAGGKGPTAEGLRAAKQYGLSLAGNIRNGKICFYQTALLW